MTTRIKLGAYGRKKGERSAAAVCFAWCNNATLPAQGGRARCNNATLPVKELINKYNVNATQHVLYACM